MAPERKKKPRPTSTVFIFFFCLTHQTQLESWSWSSKWWTSSRHRPSVSVPEASSVLFPSWRASDHPFKAYRYIYFVMFVHPAFKLFGTPGWTNGRNKEETLRKGGDHWRNCGGLFMVYIADWIPASNFLEGKKLSSIAYQQENFIFFEDIFWMIKITICNPLL